MVRTFSASIQSSTAGFRTRESGAEVVETDFAATRSISRTVKFKTSSLDFRINSVGLTASFEDILVEFRG